MRALHAVGLTNAAGRTAVSSGTAYTSRDVLAVVVSVSICPVDADEPPDASDAGLPAAVHRLPNT